MLMKNSIEAMKPGIVKVLKKHDVSRAGLFGSYARGEQRKGSDVDLLVEIKKDISLLDFAGIKVDLEDTFKRKFDLVEYSCIKPALRDRILAEEVPLI
jgi:predicted nucleotidyltransferase